jgi:hypothetical protein
MAAFNRTFRQKVVDEYLAETGANAFVPAEFLEWLEPQEDHRVWGVFFGKSDEDAARQFRLGLVRSFVSGLRIKVAVSETVNVTVPAYVSVMADRRAGGGYSAVSVGSPDTTDELIRQAAGDLARWLSRYDGICQLAGVDVAGAKATLTILENYELAEAA